MIVARRDQQIGEGGVGRGFPGPQIFAFRRSMADKVLSPGMSPVHHIPSIVTCDPHRRRRPGALLSPHQGECCST